MEFRYSPSCDSILAGKNTQMRGDRMATHGKLRSRALHSTKGDLSIIQKREREKKGHVGID